MKAQGHQGICSGSLVNFDILCSDVPHKVPGNIRRANLNAKGRQTLAVSVLWAPLSDAWVLKSLEKAYMIPLNPWISLTLVEKGLEKRIRRILPNDQSRRETEKRIVWRLISSL